MDGVYADIVNDQNDLGRQIDTLIANHNSVLRGLINGAIEEGTYSSAELTFASTERL